jgi:hypothetical protein
MDSGFEKKEKKEKRKIQTVSCCVVPASFWFQVTRGIGWAGLLAFFFTHLCFLHQH